MKSFWIAMLLLGVTLVGIGINYIYINEVSDTLYQRIETIPSIDDPTCINAAKELCSYWESHVDTVGLSVGYTVVDRVSEQSVALAACAACKDFYGFQTALALLRDAIGDMRRLEQFSIGNLL